MSGPVLWPIAALSPPSSRVGYRWNCGRHLLALSFSHPDPDRKSSIELRAPMGWRAELLKISNAPSDLACTLDNIWMERLHRMAYP